MSSPTTVREWDAAIESGEQPAPSRNTATLSRVTVDGAGLAAILGVSESFIGKLRSAGRLPKAVSLGGRVLWPVLEIEAWTLVGCPPADKWSAIREREIERWRRT